MLALALVPLASFAQPKFENPYESMLDSTFVNVDTLVINWVWAYVDSEIPTSENVKSYGGGYYAFKVKAPMTLVLKRNYDNTKGIISNYHPFIFSTIYDVFEDERSIVLYYKDKRTYYGIVYNKKIKACDRFAKKKKEWKKFVKGFRPRH
jgi:hypothetical protein